MQSAPNAPLDGDELEVLVETDLVEDNVEFVGELRYSGWSSLTLTRPLDAAAGAFELAVTDRRPWPIKPGTPVRILLAGEQLLSGYVDTLEGSSSAAGRQLRIAGRDRTADLVDCAASNLPGEWIGLPLLPLLREIAEPFGVSVESPHEHQDTPEGLLLTRGFEVFKLQHGETAWSAIERALRARAFLGYTTGDGTLIVARPGIARAGVDLIEGPHGNVKRSRFSWTSKDRFSTYVVRSQAPGTDEGWGETVSEVEGTARDSNVERFRPWLSLGETSMTFSSAADRAQWEAAVRAARAQTLEVQVQGWRRGRGLGVWKVNELADVKIPSLGVEDQMLVNRVRFTRDATAGTQTLLQLIRADAYLPKPETPKSGPLDTVLATETWEVE